MAMNTAMRILSYAISPSTGTCRACGRALSASTRQLSMARQGQAGARAKSCRRPEVAPRALISRGNPDVMQKLQKIKSSADDFDDFADDFADTEQRAEGWAGDDFAQAADSDKRVAGLETQRGELPAPVNCSIRTATYVSSAVTLQSCPAAKLPEFAVIGRSNVGKSSLINMLTNDSKLALVSKQPGAYPSFLMRRVSEHALDISSITVDEYFQHGNSCSVDLRQLMEMGAGKTKCINHFLINKSWYLVDLPGYGYAKRGRDDRLAWNKFTKEYFLKRPTLVLVMLLIDASIPPQQIDLECASWMVESEVPFTIVFTKADKTKKKGPTAAENIAAFMGILKEEFQQLPDAFVTSSIEKKGRSPLLEHLSSLQQWFETTSKTESGMGFLR